MLIDNVVSLTFGVLQNAPKVRDCYEISFKSTEVRRGDLFVVNDTAEVDDAIKNGAYALLYDEDIPISDTEIAWIKVDDLQSALTRIIRHLFLERAQVCYAIDRITVDIIETLCSDDMLSVITEGSLESIYKRVRQLSSQSTVVIDNALLEHPVFSTCKNFDSPDVLLFSVMEHSLFRCSFLVEQSYYEQQQISALLLPYLRTALEFFKYKNISYNINRLALLQHFTPLFLNQSLVIKEYGSSEKVLIMEHNEQLFEMAVEFLKQSAPWASLLILTPIDFHINKYDDILYRTFDKTLDIIALMQQHPANFTLVYHDDSLREYFSEPKPSQQLTFSL
jgi:ferrochelatase